MRPRVTGTEISRFVGDSIRLRRAVLHLSQEAISGRCGIPAITISRIEKGRNGNGRALSLDEAAAIAAALDLSLVDLIKGTIWKSS